MDELAKRSNTPRATRLTIETVDGATHDLEILEARGTGSKILTNEEIRSKFHSLVDDIVEPGRADEIERRTIGLHELGSSEELLELLRPTVRSPF
jgi:hypothetical protein